MATTPIPNTTFPATRAAINANLAQINTDMAAKADASATTAALAGKAATAHTHAIADTTGLQAAIDAKADAATTTSALAGKAATSHTHNASDINAGTLAPDRLATGTGLQVLRRNSGNTALEFATVSVGAGDMLAANNLSDVANAATARANLGLGTAATAASGDFAAASHTHSIANTTGLQAALDAKAPLASPTFTGTPTAPTATPGTNTTQVATTAFVAAAVAAVPGGTGGEDIGFGFDGAGSTLTAGLAGDRQINATRTITGWSLLGNASGSLSVAIKKATITAGSVGSFSTIYTATLSSAQFASGDGTGFTSTALTATDVLRAEVVSATGISKATLIIKA